MAKEQKEVKQVVEVSMLRRITGYLVSDIRFWNSAKKAELNDRVKHVGGVSDRNAGEDSRNT